MGFVCLVCVVTAQSPAPDAAAANAPRDGIAATVDGEPILAREVERELAIAFPIGPVAPEARGTLLAKTLEQLVSRRLIQRWLHETNQSPSERDVDFALEKLRATLVQRGVSLDEFLRQQQLDQAALRRLLAWQVGWGRFLDRQRSDANLEKFFERHRRDFDGTEVRAAHILFRVTSPDDREALSAARAKARQVLARIRSREITFADAAREFSESPSRDEGGDIGWIGRREPMPESFAQAVFALERDEVSEPIATTFGVHLVQCLDIRPGQQQWQDVRAELESAVARFLFQWAADQVRTRAKIEYAPTFPHLQPGADTVEGDSARGATP